VATTVDDTPSSVAETETSELKPREVLMCSACRWSHAFPTFHACVVVQVVAQLDRHIVGQQDAKKAVAIALRNRWRRLQLDGDLQREINPKNILMVGPTGCGKTEVARRLANLVDAPFVKVEATKFTEVGFHGRDVDMIIR